MSVLSHLCVCSVQMPDVYRGQKKASDPLELELGLLWVLGVKAGSSEKAAGALNHWAISPTLDLCI